MIIKLISLISYQNIVYIVYNVYIVYINILLDLFYSITLFSKRFKTILKPYRKIENIYIKCKM